ncbi:MAG: hypothetical protein Q9219_001072 [cf. Caloplaca sp. 3 TL-2023]
MVKRLGIIGLSADQTAWATMAHVSPFKPDGPLAHQFKLTALATSNPDSAKVSAKAHGVPLEKAYSNPEDIANDPDVDIVVVSVKVPMHKQLAMPALRANKDVFVEWPLGNGLAEAEEMAALAKKQGVKTYVGLQARVQPVFVKTKGLKRVALQVRDIVSSGALGRISSVSVLGVDNQLFHMPEKGRYVNDPNSGASILTIPVSHTIDVVLHALSSELASLTATLSTTYPTVRFKSPDGSLADPEPKTFADNISIAGTLTPSGGALNLHYLITSPGTPPLFQLIICGEKGALKLEGSSFAVQMMPPRLWRAELPKTEAEGNKGFYDFAAAGKAEWEEVEVPTSSMPGHFGGVAELYEAIALGKGKADGVVDFDEAVKRHRMVEAVKRSAEKGTRETYL